MFQILRGDKSFPNPIDADIDRYFHLPTASLFDGIGTIAGQKNPAQIRRTISMRLFILTHHLLHKD